jgi:hypothetical protein
LQALNCLGYTSRFEIGPEESPGEDRLLPMQIGAG